MEPDDAHILDAVTTVVARYGMKRTTMAELARAAGVSRQTLYDRFGDKDGIMAAAIDLIAERVCTELRAAFAEEIDLARNLDAYFRIAIWPTYKIMEAMPDAADFEKGLGGGVNCCHPEGGGCEARDPHDSLSGAPPAKWSSAGARRELL